MSTNKDFAGGHHWMGIYQVGSCLGKFTGSVFERVKTLSVRIHPVGINLGEFRVHPFIEFSHILGKQFC